MFLVIFLLISPVSKLVLPQDAADAAATDVRSKTPVVLVVMDEFDPNMLMNAGQRVDRSRYPNFAALTRTATWYRNATTVATTTTDAVPALLSSTRPRPDALPVAADYPNNVFTLLAESHSLHVGEPTTAVCPERLCGARRRDAGRERLGSLAEDLSLVSLHLLLPEELRSDLPAVDRTFADFRDDGRDDAGDDAISSEAVSGKAAPETFHKGRAGTVDKLLAGIRPATGRPGFHFLHARFRTFPGSTCRPGSSTSPVARTHPGSRASNGRTRSSRHVSACSDICCRLATRTAWWGGSWIGFAGLACSIPRS